MSSQYITTDNRGALFTGCCYPYYGDDHDDDEGIWSRFEDENHVTWWDLPIDEAIQKYGSDYGAIPFGIEYNGTYSDGDF